MRFSSMRGCATIDDGEDDDDDDDFDDDFDEDFPLVAAAVA